MMSSPRFASFALALCFASTASAGAPAGVSDEEIGGANEVWYLSGDNEECDGDSDLYLCIQSSAVTDGSGAVTGTGAFNFTGFLAGNLPMTLSGQMAGTAAKPLGKVAVSFSGPATLDLGDMGPLGGIASGSGKLTCRNPLPHGEFFVCRGGLKLCFEAPIGTRSHRICQGGGGFEMQVRAGGGPWTLSTDLATDPNGIVTGGATATLANTGSEIFSVTGKYKPKNDQTTLKHVSTEPLSKNKLSLVDQLIKKGTVRSHVLTFKVAGETGKQTTLGAP